MLVAAGGARLCEQGHHVGDRAFDERGPGGVGVAVVLAQHPRDRCRDGGAQIAFGVAALCGAEETAKAPAAFRRQ